MSAEIVRLRVAQQTSAIPKPQPAPKRTWQLSPETIRKRLAYKVAFAERLARKTRAHD
jgi:hypothetical protein